MKQFYILVGLILAQVSWAQEITMPHSIALTSAYETASERGSTHYSFFSGSHRPIYHDGGNGPGMSGEELHIKDFQEFLREDFKRASGIQGVESPVMVVIIHEDSLSGAYQGEAVERTVDLGKVAKEMIDGNSEMRNVEVVVYTETAPPSPSRAGPLSGIAHSLHMIKASEAPATFSVHLMETTPGTMAMQKEVALTCSVLGIGREMHLNIRPSGVGILKKRLVPGLLGALPTIVPTGMKVTVTLPSSTSLNSPIGYSIHDKESFSLRAFLDKQVNWTQGEARASLSSILPLVLDPSSTDDSAKNNRTLLEFSSRLRRRETTARRQLHEARTRLEELKRDGAPTSRIENQAHILAARERVHLACRMDLDILKTFKGPDQRLGAVDTLVKIERTMLQMAQTQSGVGVGDMASPPTVVIEGLELPVPPRRTEVRLIRTSFDSIPERLRRLKEMTRIKPIERMAGRR